MTCYRASLIFIILTLILTGCTKTRILEQVNIITVSGYDKLTGSDGKIKVTSIIESLEPGKEGKAELMAQEAGTSKGARGQSNLKSPKPLVSGQLRVTLYGRDLAEENGIINITDTLSRDPRIGNLVFLAIADDTTDNILAYKYKSISNIGDHIYLLLKQNIDNQILPSCTLHEYIREYYSDGKDFILPILKREGEEIKIENLALLNGEKLVGEIAAENVFLIQILDNKGEMMLKEVKIDTEGLKKERKAIEENEAEPDEFNVVFEVININTKIKLVNPKSHSSPVFDIHSDIDIAVSEIDANMNLADQNVKEQISKKIDKKLEEDMHEFLSQLQDMKSDVIGFGEIYNRKKKIKSIDSDKWREKFSQAEFKVNFDTRITRTGATE